MTTRTLTVDDIVTPEGVTYEPWTDGYAVGYRVVHQDGRPVEYIYLNPSSGDASGDADAQPNVFVYQGAAGDTAQDQAAHHYDVLEPAQEQKF